MRIRLSLWCVYAVFPSLFLSANAYANPAVSPVPANTLKTPDAHLLAINELKRIAAPSLAAFANQPDGPAFLQFLNQESVIIPLLTSGYVPSPIDQSLSALYSIWRADAKSLAHPKDLSTALAAALSFGESDWPAKHALARYQFFRDSQRAGALHPMFDSLQTWEKRYLMRAGHNGTYAHSDTWDNRSLTWLRDQVKLPAKDYVDACWQAPYRLNNVFGDSIHGDQYYLPFGQFNHAERVREVGGVCGSLSHYGANAAIANGIPALTMGEPGHCAYAVRTSPDSWTPAYSLSWERHLHTSLWFQHTWTALVLQNKVLADRPAHEKSLSFLWQARALQQSDPTAALQAFRSALQAQPLNQPAWLEAVDFFLSQQPDLATAKTWHLEALAALKEYPEAAWEVLLPLEEYLLPKLPDAEKIPFLSTFHRSLATVEGPIMWHFDQALGQQAFLLSNPTQQLAFFESVVSIQAASKSWFAPTIAWGESQFAKNPALVDAFYAALSRAFSSPNATANPEGLRSALRPAIIAAEQSDNVSAFQSLGKIGQPFLPKKPLDIETFPGDLLSSGGLLKLSSTSQWDSPELHWGVLEPSGGKLHTNNEVRPHAIARLGKLGDLSGLIIVNEGGNGHNGRRQLPLRVSISEDGKKWTSVFEATEYAPHWRIPLTGKATRVQFIKCERSDDRKEVFHLKAIHAYGKKLQ